MQLNCVNMFAKQYHKRSHIFMKQSIGADTGHMFHKKLVRHPHQGKDHSHGHDAISLPGQGHSIQSLRGMPVRINNNLEKAQ